MFENYPTYAKQVLSAAKKMSADQKARHGKIGIASVATIALGGIVIMASGNAIAASQFDVAMSTLKDGFADDSVNIEVETEETQQTTLLAEEAKPLSASDEAAVTQQIKDCISADKVIASDAKIIDGNTTEITVTTADGIPVKITLKKADGTYKIDSAKAMLDANAIRERKAASANPISTDLQKEAYAAPLNEFNEDAFNTIAGVDPAASEEDKTSAYNEHVSTIAPEVMLSVPSGFSSQEVEQPAEPEQAENTGEINEENVNEALDTAVEAIVGDEALSPAEKAKAERSSVKQYARSWKNGNGSTISVRAENLGEAFSGMTGIDAITKMKGYWEETSSSVANGAGQTLKNPEEGYVTENFYDVASGMWGYWGHVVYTDGSRDIVYNRVVMIDEISDQMFTISYRNDSESSEESTAYTLVDFKNLVTHAPALEIAEAKEAIGDGTVETIKIATATAVEDKSNASASGLRKAYEDSLNSTLILPGHSKTVATEKKEAEEAAKAAEEAKKAPEEKPADPAAPTE